MTSLEPSSGYRQEILAPLFALIRARESCVIIGASNVGKSRLQHHLSLPEVRRHYLDSAADELLIALCDCHRLGGDDVSEWGLYELILTAIIEACGQHPRAQLIRDRLGALRAEVINSNNALLARRDLELALVMLCRELGLQLCLILDEFDQPYAHLPKPTLAGLRALRDANKAWLSYVLLLCQHPARLRSPDETDSFSELFSRSILGLQPYRMEDALAAATDVIARRAVAVGRDAAAQVAALAGGHAGLITAAIDAIAAGASTDAPTLCLHPSVRDECSRIWARLAHDEQLALRLAAFGDAVPPGDGAASLLLKGLLREGAIADAVFSPLFAAFVRDVGQLQHQAISVDERLCAAWVGARRVTDLTAREFDLLALMARHAGRVLSRQEILQELNPEEAYTESLDNSVDALVKRVRRKIEPVPGHPRYLLTVRGKGYRLVTDAESLDDGAQQG